MHCKVRVSFCPGCTDSKRKVIGYKKHGFRRTMFPSASTRHAIPAPTSKGSKPSSLQILHELLVCDVDRCFIHPANQELQRSRGVAISMHLFTHQPEFHGHRAACSLTESTPSMARPLLLRCPPAPGFGACVKAARRPDKGGAVANRRGAPEFFRAAWSGRKALSLGGIGSVA